MQRWRGLDAAPPDFGPSVVTVGMFDGVHRGHQEIVGRAVARARAAGLPAVVLTFDPHPVEVVRPGSHPAVLTPLPYKAELLGGLGVDVTCVLPFTLDFSRLSPEEFVRRVLVDHLHPAAVVVGGNFRYGHRAAGDVPALTASGAELGFEVEGVALLATEGSRLSSTRIRALVAEGDVAAAALALGRPHRTLGVVVHGDARGRELGYPTANLETTAHAAIPADGVYAGWLVRESGEQLAAAVSVGTNPTFAGQQRRVEAYVLDWQGDLYGEHVAFAYDSRLRGTWRFDGVEPLVAQMKLDVEETRRRTAAATGASPAGSRPTGGNHPDG